METNKILKKDNLTFSKKDQGISDFDEITYANIFCPLCHMYPEYFIRFTSASSFNLIHSCICGTTIEKSFNSEKSDSFIDKCVYCNKKCNQICIKCKNAICKGCSREHNKIPYVKDKQSTEILSDEEKYIKPIIKCQFICDIHLLLYKFYCPVCKINICKKCKEGHFHMNCPNLLKEKINYKDIIEPSNDCYKRLYKLSKEFYSCYENNLSDRQMTLNILMNAYLANKIVIFIQQKTPSEGIEIKNEYLCNIDESLFLSHEYDNLEFNKYYSNLIFNASVGNIVAYHKINEIRKKYKNEDFPEAFRDDSYYEFISSKKSKLLIEFDLAIVKIDVNEINLNLSKFMRMVSCLKLKNEITEFYLELMKHISKKMNYKLDFELRRKIGNILGEGLLKKFKDNLKEIEPTKTLITLSSEYIKDELENNLNKENNKVKEEELSKKIDSLKLNYIKSLNMLIEKAMEEIKDVDNIKPQQNSKENANKIRFKNLNNSTEEIKKAILCNLFFYIRWKLGDKFNQQIHNITLSINSILLNEINKIENNIKEKEDSNAFRIIQKDGAQNTNSKNVEDSNETSIKVQNKSCPNQFYSLEKLNNQIKVEEESISRFQYINSIEEYDPIINSNTKEFVKILHQIQSTFCTSADITLEQSLNLYLDGKKGDVFKKNSSFINLNKVIKDCESISSYDNGEINEINAFCKKLKTQLKYDSELLYTFLKMITKEIEKLYNFFDINYLFEKYKIVQPLNPIKALSAIRNITNEEYGEETYYLILLFLYFFVSSNINILDKIKSGFERIDLEELTKSNIIKKNLIKSFISNISDLDGNILNSNIWSELKYCHQFVEDEELNKSIIKYVEKNSQEEFKNDLIQLIKPYFKGINLEVKDPQNIILEPFMLQKELMENLNVKE